MTQSNPFNSARPNMPPPPAGNSAPSRFGPPPQQPATPPTPPTAQSTPPAPRPFRSFGSNCQWAQHPVHKTVALFDLKGLGDPFYRLMGHDFNEDYSDYRKVITAMVSGGDAVDGLVERLNTRWERYPLQGAALVYPWAADNWKAVTAPPEPVSKKDDDEFDDLDDEPQKPYPNFSCLRAIDLELVLNVLARSRTQVLMMRAPLILAKDYLTRTLYTDDPRLVSLVKATGYLQEGS